MYNNQDGKCAICGMDGGMLKRGLAIDHDHNTNKIRGLLCGKCNTALGLLNENEKLFFRCIKYIRENK